MSYIQKVIEEAVDNIIDFEEFIIKEAIESNGDIKRLSLYAEKAFRKYFDLTSSVEILEELKEYQEKDPSFYENEDPEESCKLFAFFTFNNAVVEYTNKIICQIKQDKEWQDAAEDKNKIKMRQLIEKHCNEFLP